jgi:nitroreductase
VYPRFFTDEPVSDEQILTLLEAANWAPTHRMTEPWRFIVIRGARKAELGRFLAEQYKSKQSESSFSERKYKGKKEKAERSSAVIAIILQRDPAESVPEWEELAAVSAAVQNLWITASALGLGGYWSSPQSMVGRPDFLALPTGQSCFGLFYLGHHNMPELPRERKPVGDKVQWWG